LDFSCLQEQTEYPNLGGPPDACKIGFIIEFIKFYYCYCYFFLWCGVWIWNVQL